MHRIATSGRYRTDPHVIRETWTWDEVLEANAILDAFDAAEDEAKE